MAEKFRDMLTVGGRTNSLGRSAEVIEAVLQDRRRLDELFECLFADDAWIRMRAVDSLEKICRLKPDWLGLYIDRLIDGFSDDAQASIQWHMAEIYAQVDLTERQRMAVILWLSRLLSTPQIDWIVAANAMKTLGQFAEAGWIPKQEAIRLIGIQRQHRSKAVVKRSNGLLDQLSRA